MSKLSIAIPCYNEVRFLRKTLESVIGEADEIIISDNASTDGTSEICQEFAVKFPEIKYFRQEENIGSIKNFKFIFERCTGDYFRYIGAHDLISQGSSKSMLNIIESDPGISMVYPKYHLYIRDDYSIYDCYSYPAKEGREKKLKSDFAYIRLQSYLEDVQCGRLFYALYKTELIKQVISGDFLLFNDMSSEVSYINHALICGKAIVDPSAVYFELDNHTTYCTKNAIKVTMGKLSSKKYDTIAFDISLIGECYQSALTVQNFTETPPGFANQMLDVMLSKFTFYSQWVKNPVLGVDTPVPVPGKEIFVKNIYAILLEFRSKEQSYSKRFIRLLRKILKIIILIPAKGIRFFHAIKNIWRGK